jgi:hypothetical protein
MERGLNPEVEVIEPARPGRRRRFTAEKKRKIAEETTMPDHGNDNERVGL